MTDDISFGSEGPIIVRRAVFEAACILEKQNKKDNRYPADFMMAQERQSDYLAEGNQIEADFWKEVFQYLMTLESVAAGTPVEIID